MIKLYACTKPSCILRSAEFMYMHFYTYIHVKVYAFLKHCVYRNKPGLYFYKEMT